MIIYGNVCDYLWARMFAALDKEIALREKNGWHDFIRRHCRIQYRKTKASPGR